jgi:hypothetical protein
MAFQRTSWGCELTLMSINAAYRVQLVKGDRRLRCVRERYGVGEDVIHESEDHVGGWEKLHERILWLEGVQIETLTERMSKAQQASKQHWSDSTSSNWNSTRRKRRRKCLG